MRVRSGVGGLLASLLSGVAAAGQAQPIEQSPSSSPPSSIAHTPPACLGTSIAPMLGVALTTEAGPTEVTLDFRREGSLYWYRVPVRREGQRFVARIPRPRPGARRVEYVVTVGAGGHLVQSAVFVVPVDPDCPEVQAAAPVERVTVEHERDAPALPSGFVADDLHSRVAPLARLGPLTEEVGIAARTAGRPAALGLPIPSDRIRVLTRGELRGGHPPLVGTLLEENDRELVLRPEGSTDRIVVPRSALVLLEYSRPSSLGRRLRLGALIGGGLAYWKGARSDGGLLDGWATGCLYTPVGVALGAVAGAAWPSGDDWRSVASPSEPPRPTEGLGFGISVRF